MQPHEIELLVQNLMGHYGWLLVTGFVALFLKDIIHNFVAGAMVFLGTDLDEDDIIYISGRKARVSRCGWRKTIFYMYEGNTKMIVPNERLKNLTIEKRLPTNGGGQSKDYNN